MFFFKYYHILTGITLDCTFRTFLYISRCFIFV